MKTTRKNVSIQFLLLSLALITALAGCQGMPPVAFSPESAVQQEVLNRPMPDFAVDPGSIQVLQMADLAGKKIVLISFQGNRVNSGRESCLFTYEVFRDQMGGWQTGGGGGGCGSEPPNPIEQPISIGSGKSGGGMNDIGHSEVDGRVFDSKVAMVQVTWSDGAQQQASVINNSYLVVRAGEFDLSKLEALDVDQKVIFTQEMQTAPGKQ